MGGLSNGTSATGLLTAFTASILGIAFLRKYVSDRSIPTPCRPSSNDVATVVPLPTNGSSTTHGLMSPVKHPHALCHPAVSRLAMFPSRVLLVPGLPLRDHSKLRSLLSSSFSGVDRPPVLATSRSYGFPHPAQHPASDVPARMHGVISAGENVAKWAPG